MQSVRHCNNYKTKISLFRLYGWHWHIWKDIQMIFQSSVPLKSLIQNVSSFCSFMTMLLLSTVLSLVHRITTWKVSERRVGIQILFEISSKTRPHQAVRSTSAYLSSDTYESDYRSWSRNLSTPNNLRSQARNHTYKSIFRASKHVPFPTPFRSSYSTSLRSMPPGARCPLLSYFQAHQKQGAKWCE